MAEIGAVYRGGHIAEWFVGAYSSRFKQPVGVCFMSAYSKSRIGKAFSMSSCERVSIDQVPEDVLIELTKWRLLNG